jgi:hypothetical protein
MLRPLPKATHEGILTIGDIEVPCAVLEDGRRVLTQSGVMVALGRARQAKGRQYYDADVNLPAFLTAKNLKPFIPDDLSVASSQIQFKTLGGSRAFGYSADLLPKVCGVFLDAQAARVLNPRMQGHIAERALILIRGFASVGIIALVDEATGFQYDRPRRDLEEYFWTWSLRYILKTPHCLTIPKTGRCRNDFLLATGSPEEATRIRRAHISALHPRSIPAGILRIRRRGTRSAHLGHGVAVEHLPQFVPVQTRGQLADECHRHQTRASRRGMDKIRGYQPGLAIVPARHGARAAHHFERIEETAMQFRGHAALNVDDARNGGQRYNRLALLAAVHGTHPQYRSIGQRRAHWLNWVEADPLT